MVAPLSTIKALMVYRHPNVHNIVVTGTTVPVCYMTAGWVTTCRWGIPLLWCDARTVARTQLVILTYW